MNQNEQIRLLEAARCKAMLEGDAAALDALISEKLVWTHSVGSTDDKSAFLNRIRGAKTRYLSIERSDEVYFETSGALVSSGIARMDVIVDEKPHRLLSRYLNVWFEEDGTWRLVAWQSTPIAK